MRTIGAAAVAAAMALGMAPSAIGASMHNAPPPRTGRGRPVLLMTNRQRVPKSLRQYAKRYAKKSPSEVLSMHARFPAPMLDHWRERAEGKPAAGNVTRIEPFPEPAPRSESWPPPSHKPRMLP